MWMYILMLGYFVLFGLAVYLMAMAYRDLNKALAKLIRISEQRQNVKYVMIHSHTPDENPFK